MNTSKVLTFKFYSDPGHGWLACKSQLLHELGIFSAITRYSYIRGGTVYLEEDCDAVKLINVLKEKNIEYKIESVNVNGRSPIRSYDRMSG